MTEERKREIELELVDMADSLRNLAGEVGCSLDLHAYFNKMSEEYWTHCAVTIFYRKKVDGKRYITNVEQYIRERNDSDINPLAGFLSEEPTEWQLIKEDE